ncbi:MAG: SCO family protein [Bacteroidetes bacterium]|nr:SCO family protein [Bacteroidota bacterium]
MSVTKMTKHILFLFFLSFTLIFNACQDNCQLPFLGPHEVVADDTIYYTIPKFYGWKNQNGEPFDFKKIEGKIFVAEFFFSQCKSICPIMTSQMARVQDEITQNQWQSKVSLLSHTVDPLHDQPDVLQAYAKSHGADFSIWTFVNADTNVYQLAQKGYLLSAFPSDSADGGFFHTDQLTLVDEHFRIRGYYDGTSTERVDQLIKDLKCLIQEEH